MELELNPAQTVIINSNIQSAMMWWIEIYAITDNIIKYAVTNTSIWIAVKNDIIIYAITNDIIEYDITN